MMSGTRKWLKQTITVYPHLTLDSSGQYTFGTGVSVSCMIIEKMQNTRDATGNDVISKSQILIDGGVTISQLDKIVLPDGSTPFIINILNVPNIVNGQSYAKIIYT